MTEKWLNKRFKQHPEGWIVYKVVNMRKGHGVAKTQSEGWKKKIRAGVGVLRDRNKVDMDIRRLCARGNHFAPKGWITSTYHWHPHLVIVVCLLKKTDLHRTCIPDYSRGIARTKELTIIRVEPFPKPRRRYGR